MGVSWSLVVENPPSSAGDMGLIPSWGTKISHAIWLAQGNKKSCLLKLRLMQWKHTYTHTHIYIYVCVCVCLKDFLSSVATSK